MTITKFFSLATLALGVSALSANAGDYKVNVTFGEDDLGAMAYLVNYDTGKSIDSVHIDEQTMTFAGKIDKPLIARVLVDGQRRGTFFVEDGVIDFDTKTRKVVGGSLNSLSEQFNEKTNKIGAEYQAAESDSLKAAVYGKYQALVHDEMVKNIDNAFGYSLFLDLAGDMSPEEVQATVDKYPSLKEYKKVNKYLEANAKKAATQPGCKFVDFEISYDGQSHRLSDVVGKGDYVLVDFWASWCGPCIRQTAVIKDIYKEYKDSGLKVLGVAVWDEPENTLGAIKQHELPWECWLNGQNVPTDAYGIMGIPCIILFGPDGTILSRDKQSDELKADVRAALTK
jgi:thiol-disulfide isomerase/thioredoxin